MGECLKVVNLGLRRRKDSLYIFNRNIVWLKATTVRPGEITQMKNRNSMISWRAKSSICRYPGNPKILNPTWSLAWDCLNPKPSKLANSYLYQPISRPPAPFLPKSSLELKKPFLKICQAKDKISHWRPSSYDSRKQSSLSIQRLKDLSMLMKKTKLIPFKWNAYTKSRLL